MTSECYELSTSQNALINTIILSSSSSLIDMLNQQSFQATDENDSTPKSDGQINENNHFLEYDKLSTLFNTTGRERNSTGPLKQWLYEHQDHPYPKESDKQELMKQTKMSASQITIWFTNARVKMRKEKKLLSKSHGKKARREQPDDIQDIISFDEDIFSLNIDPLKRFVIAYSSLNLQEMIDLHQFASLYPDQISITDCVDDQTTHLIMGKEDKPLLCPLTKKLYQSIARHLYIITYRWISDCLKENTLIDESNYEIRGDIPFNKYHDGMKNSRLSKQMKLFRNCHFFILCEDCQDKMSKDELASLIQLSHGSLLETFPLTRTENSLLTIVLCYKLLPFNDSNQKQLFELSRSNGVYFLNPEWILESVVQFDLQPLKYYEEEF